MTGQNAEKELIAQLKSEKRSVIIQAIVKLTRAGQSEQAIKALQPLLGSSDREISFFAAQAVSKIAQKTGLNPDSIQQSNNPPSAESSETEKKYGRRAFLDATPATAPALLEIIRTTPDLLEDDALPAIGIFLSRFGSATDGAFLEKILQKENSNLALPLINAAEHIAPAIIPRVLPHLLASAEPLVRSRSISALRKIDPEEAERHFSDLLASRNPENRLAGIGISFLFPFDRVKGYVLSLLPDENDAEVLTACRTVLASNPDVDTALSILDSIDSVAAEQKTRLSGIFRAVCHAIAAAGILASEEATPEMLVKLWKQQRLEAFLYDLEIQLSFADESKKQSIVSWINRNREHAKVKELIDRLGRNPQTEELHRQLSQKPESDAVQPVSVKAAVPSGNEPPTAEQKLEILKNLELESFKSNKIWIMKDAMSGTPALRTEALNAILRVHPDGKLVDLGKEALLDSSSEVRTAGFKILERLAPDLLKEKLSQLLQEDDANLRVRAVRFGLKFREKDCIDVLQRLIGSPEQNIRSNAISCLAICPFASVYMILMDQLDREEHPVIVRQITSILLNNPSKNVLKALDSITRTTNPAVSMVISQARNDLFDLIATLPADREPEPSEAKTPGDKPYSVSNVREIARKNQSWQPSYKATKEAKPVKVAETNWQMIISGSILLVFLAMLPIMLLSDKESSTAGASRKCHKTIEHQKE